MLHRYVALRNHCVMPVENMEWVTCEKCILHIRNIEYVHDIYIQPCELIAWCMLHVWIVILIKKCMLHMAYIKKACRIDIRPFETIAWCMLHVWNVAHIKKCKLYGTSQTWIYIDVQPFEPIAWCSLHIWMKEPCYSYECVVPHTYRLKLLLVMVRKSGHMNESYHTSECVMSYALQSYATHSIRQCCTCQKNTCCTYEMLHVYKMHIYVYTYCTYTFTIRQCCACQKIHAARIEFCTSNTLHILKMHIHIYIHIIHIHIPFDIVALVLMHAASQTLVPSLLFLYIRPCIHIHVNTCWVFL